MTVPPNPPGQTLRIRLIYAMAGGEGGNRFYFTFTGGRPTTADCNTLASDVATAWGAHLQAMCSADVALKEVDLLDITDNMGSSGTWSGSLDGSRAGVGLLTQSCAAVEFDISRRYRGGKPRIYFPGGVEGDLADQSNFDSGFVTALNAAVLAFVGAVSGLTSGTTVVGQHINLSFYTGFKNIANTSGRERAVPQYRAPGTVIADAIGSYATKTRISSQRRRRNATTP